jgi:hypothetical protein
MHSPHLSKVVSHCNHYSACPEQCNRRSIYLPCVHHSKQIPVTVHFTTNPHRNKSVLVALFWFPRPLANSLRLNLVDNQLLTYIKSLKKQVTELRTSNELLGSRNTLLEEERNNLSQHGYAFIFITMLLAYYLSKVCQLDRLICSTRHHSLRKNSSG